MIAKPANNFLERKQKTEALFDTIHDNIKALELMMTMLPQMLARRELLMRRLMNNTKRAMDEAFSHIIAQLEEQKSRYRIYDATSDPLDKYLDVLFDSTKLPGVEPN